MKSWKRSLFPKVFRFSLFASKIVIASPVVIFFQHIFVNNKLWEFWFAYQLITSKQPIDLQRTVAASIQKSFLKTFKRNDTTTPMVLYHRRRRRHSRQDRDTVYYVRIDWISAEFHYYVKSKTFYIFTDCFETWIAMAISVDIWA